MEEDDGTTCEKIKSVLGNIVTTIDNLWNWRNGMHSTVLKEIPVVGRSMIGRSFHKKLRENSHIKQAYNRHKSLARELQRHRDLDARNKAVLGHLEDNFLCRLRIFWTLLKQK